MTAVSPCPSLAELFDEPSRFAAHVASCLRCRALALELPAGAAVEQDQHVAPTLGGPRRTQAAPGDVCTVAFATRDEYLVAVVLDSVDGTNATVVALSDETTLTAPPELRVDPNVLGYEVALDPAIIGPVIAEQIHEVLGRVAPPILETAKRTSGTSTGSDVDPARNNEPDRAERIEYYRGFWTPAEMIERSPRLSDLIRQRARLAGVGESAIDDALGGAKILADLDAGMLDLKAHVEPSRLLATLRLLGIALHEGTARLIGQAAAIGYAPSRRATGAPGLGPIRGRREISAAERRGQAQAYLDELWANASGSDLE